MDVVMVEAVLESTNVVVAGFGNRGNLVRKRYMLAVEDVAKVARRVVGVE